MTADVFVDRHGEVDLITLNRPAVRNALTRQTYADLEHAVRTSTARCMVVTGTDPAFCAGDDVREFMTGGRLTAYLEEEDALSSFTEALLFTNIPVIAAVNGVAAGWGMELTLLADVRIASERARFGEVFALRGLCSDVPGIGLLAQLVGREQAARLLFTGEIIDAHEAKAIGLVSEIVPHECLLPRALEFARRVAENPPLAVQRLKEGLRRARDPDWHRLGTWVRRSQAELSRTDDYSESLRSFLEKRTPHYQGR